MDNQYHSGAHSKYLTQYHIVWCPKFRYNVLVGYRAEKLREILFDICNTYGYGVKALEIMPDHIHIFVDAPQTIAPCDVVRVLKSNSARMLLAEFPDLRAFYSRCKVLWSDGHFISSVGYISENTVRKYIEGQKYAEKKKKQD
jgi:putative transposase